MSKDISKDITPYNHKGQPHGFWELYWFNDGSLWHKCYLVNGKAMGYEELYHRRTNNLISNKEFYLK